jgi:hypothetical protein
MLQQVFSTRKSQLFALAGLVLFALILLGWQVVSLQKKASEAAVAPVLKIGYCGAELKELCVLSFGRDVEENMVVNLFVPVRQVPDFYLKIKRAAGESLYKCEQDSEVRTSVFCYGELVNLQEKMEVSLYSKNEDRLLAMGNFILNAVLISEPVQVGGISTPEVELNLTPSPPDFFVAPTATDRPIPTVTVTPTLGVSYPDSSYPNSSYP